MKKTLAAALIAAASLTAGAASATTYWVDHGVKLNARSGPGTHYKVLGTFSPCTRVHVVAYSRGWAKVVIDHHAYWVSAKYLQNRACGPVYKKSYGY